MTKGTLVMVAISLMVGGAFFHMLGYADGTWYIGYTDPTGALDALELLEEGAQPFIENKGQWDEDILFISRTSYGHIGLCRGSILIHLFMAPEKGLPDPFDASITNKDRPLNGCIVRISFCGSNDAVPKGSAPVGRSYNFMKGKDPSRWGLGCQGFSTVTYSDLWDGIDLLYRVTEKDAKYELSVSTGADAGSIGFRVEGHSSISLMYGDLIIGTPIGPSLIDRAPSSYYTDGSREHLRSDFKLTGPDSYTIVVPDREEGRPVLIDPLMHSSFIGGMDWETPGSLTMAVNGDLLMAGYTWSFDFPTTPGAYSAWLSSLSDGFVLRMKGNLSSLVFSTYVGGSMTDEFSGIDTDADGNCYVLGISDSNDFPVTKGAFNSTLYNNSRDLVTFKLDSSGSSLIYSTFIGGSQGDFLNGEDMLRLDSDGCAVIVASTESPDFPVTDDAFDRDFESSGGATRSKAVLLKVSSDGSSLMYSTFYGGSESTVAYGMDLDAGGCVYFGGMTSSPDLPVTEGAFSVYKNGWWDAFAVRFDISMSMPLASTYIGGTQDNKVEDVACGPSGEILLTGITVSPDFPVTEGAYDTGHNGDYDAFVSIISASGCDLLHSTFLGGGNFDWSSSIAVDGYGHIVVTGSSSSLDFPYLFSELSPNSNDDLLFVARFSPDLSKVPYSLALGGSDWEYSDQLLIDLQGDAVISGMTQSGDFPVTEDAMEDTYSAAGDIFVSVVNFSVPPGTPVDVALAPGDRALNITWGAPMVDGGMPVDGYLVSRSVLGYGFTIIGEVRNGTWYEDRDLIMGQVHVYKVCAFSRAGAGEWSEPLSSRAVGRPTPPLDFELELKDGRIWLSWGEPRSDGASDLTGYVLYKQMVSGGGTTAIEIGPMNLEYIDGDVVTGRPYLYWLTAKNSVGESDPTPRLNGTPAVRPSPPANITSKSGRDFIEVRWECPASDGGSPITIYHVYLMESGSESILWRMVCASSCYFNDTSVVMGRTYRYYVAAVNALGESEPSSEVQTSPMSVPSPPMEPKAEAGDRSITITWGLPEELGGLALTGYRIYRSSESSGFVMIAQTQTEVLFYKDSSLKNGQSYSYRVTALNPCGESMPSAEMTGVPASVPGAPIEVRCHTGSGSITISWGMPESDGGAAITGFRIYRTVEGSGPERIGDVRETNTSFIDRDISNGTSYVYTVKACNRIGESRDSPEARADPKGAPSSPQGLMVRAGNGFVEISWEVPVSNGGEELTGYRLSRWSSSYSAPTIVANLVPAVLFYKDTKVDNGRTYNYTVSAVNSLGESLGAPRISARPIGPPPKPIGVACSIEDGPVKVSWVHPSSDGGSPVVLYRIYRKGPGEDGFSRIGSVESSEMAFLDHDVKGGSVYSYSVKAVSSLGEGDGSEEVSIEIPKDETKDTEGTALLTFMAALIVLLAIVIALLILSLRRRKRSEDSTIEALSRFQHALQQGRLEGNQVMEGQQFQGPAPVPVPEPYPVQEEGVPEV